MSRKLLRPAVAAVAAVADCCHEALAPTRNFPGEQLLVLAFH
jgi:hypothetical protein